MIYRIKVVIENALLKAGKEYHSHHIEKIKDLEYIIYEYISESEEEYRNYKILPYLIHEASAFIIFMKDNRLFT